MNIFKNLRLIALAALAVTLLFAAPSAQAAGDSQVVIGFTKWVTVGNQMEGVADGGTYTGEVLNLDAIAGGQIWKIDARYDFHIGERSFSAVIYGIHSWHTGNGVLNGVITDGWNAGSRVQVKFVAIPSAEHGFVFQGTITIIPN